MNNNQTNGIINTTGECIRPKDYIQSKDYIRLKDNYAGWRSKALPRPSTSLCIPRMEASVSRDYIYSVFNQLNIGHIEQMNEIPLRNEKDFKRILLRIRLNNSETANTVGRF